MNKVFKRILDLLWPFLEGKPIKYNNWLKKEDVDPEKVNSNTIDYCLKMYEYQKSRISSIESKSMVLIGFFAGITTLLIFGIKDILFELSKTRIHYILLFGLSVIIIYISQIIRFSIKTFERQSYQSFSEKTFLNCQNDDIVFNLINTIKQNYDVINSKVDSMTLALEFVKRVLFVIFTTAITLLIYSSFHLIPTEGIKMKELFNFIMQNHYNLLLALCFIILIPIVLQLRNLTTRTLNLEKTINFFKAEKDNSTKNNSAGKTD